MPGSDGNTGHSLVTKKHGGAFFSVIVNFLLEREWRRPQKRRKQNRQNNDQAHVKSFRF